MPILAMSAGTVTAVWGNAFVRLPNGSLKPVQVGDKVKGGERILTDEDGIVEISPAKGASVLVKAIAAPEAVNKAIAGIEGQDPDQAPAAGLTGGAEGGMQPGLRVDRVSESVGQQAFDFGTGPGQANAPLGSSADQRLLASPQGAPEAAPQASINNVDVNEGAGSAVFTITLDNPSTSPVTIQYTTQEGSASSHGDFTPTSGSVTFNPGETSKSVTVPVKNDAVYEGSEQFTVKLSAPTNAALAKDTGLATIHDDGTGSVPTDVVPDDDRPHVVSVSDAQTTEGGELAFHVQVSNSSTTVTTLTLKLSGLGEHPATPGTDTAPEIKVSVGNGEPLPAQIDADGIITFPLPAFTGPETDIVVHVYTKADGQVEGLEALQLSVTTPHDTVMPANTGAGVIVDADTRPYMLVLNGEPAVEGSPVGFNVVLTHASSEPVTVKLALANLTDASGVPEADGARIGLDTGTQLEYETADGSWVPVPSSGLLTFSPGDTLLHVRVATVDDKEVESTEYVKLVATVVAGDTANGLNVPTSNKTALIDNDLPPVAAIHDHVSATDTNLMIVLDTSGSMNSDSGIHGLTRMDAAIEAIKNLLDRYDQIGDVAVRLVLFSTNASEQGSAWLSVSDAKALLASMEHTGDGATYYNHALSAAKTAFDTVDGKLGNAQNVAYFLSDGVPTEPHVGTNFGDGRLSAEEQLDWLRFVDSHQIKSYAIGMGGDVSNTFLDGIACDGQASADTNGVVVSDFAQLDQVLSGTTHDFVQGSISTAGALGQAGSEFLHVSSIVVDGAEHAFQSGVLTVHTNLGGLFSIDMSTGEYSYAAPAQLADGVATETIGFSLINAQGQTSTSTLDIQFDHTHVIAGTSVSESLTGSNTVDWLMGRQGNDTIVADGGNDQLFGNAGNDELHGDAGDDLLVGGQGNDTMFGGSGSDVFAWHLSDRGASGAEADRAVDTLKDFDAHAPSAGGDVLDLRDLLQGENTAGGTGNLDHYLQFDTTGGNTVIKVGPTGDFVPGDTASGTASQHIVIEGGHFLTDLGLDTSATNVQIIAKLLQQGNLLVDHA